MLFERFTTVHGKHSILVQTVTNLKWLWTFRGQFQQVVISSAVFLSLFHPRHDLHFLSWVPRTCFWRQPLQSFLPNLTKAWLNSTIRILVALITTVRYQGSMYLESNMRLACLHSFFLKQWYNELDANFFHLLEIYLAFGEFEVFFKLSIITVQKGSCTSENIYLLLTHFRTLFAGMGMTGGDISANNYGCPEKEISTISSLTENRVLRPVRGIMSLSR